MENEEEEEFEILDDDWLKEFEQVDNLYKDYYSEDVTHVNNYYIYVNKFNEIEKIKNEIFQMQKPNHISREEIIGILKKMTRKNYSILYILKYNINLTPLNVKDFLSSPNNFDFITSLKRIQDVFFDKTINMFQDMNDLMFIFYENEKDSLKKYNSTKRVTIKPFSKKTIKKRFTIHHLAEF